MNSTSAAASTLVLGQSGEAWDMWVIFSLVLAFAAALAVAAATTGSVVAHKRESRAAEPPSPRCSPDAYQRRCAVPG